MQQQSLQEANTNQESPEAEMNEEVLLEIPEVAIGNIEVDPISPEAHESLIYPVIPPPDIETRYEETQNVGCLQRVFKRLGSREREGFIVKVYGLLFIQLMITTIIVAMTMIFPKIRTFMNNNKVIVWICIPIAVIIPLLFYFWKSKMRIFPLNYVLLFTFTFVESYLVANITAICEPYRVLVSAGFTLFLVIGLTLFALFSNRDITLCYVMPWMSVFLIIPFVIFISIKPHEFLQYLIMILVCLVLGVYILWDTQMIMGGKKWAIEYDDYSFAVIILYLDIIAFFLAILKLFSCQNQSLTQ